MKRTLLTLALFLLAPLAVLCSPEPIGRIQLGGPVAPDGITEVQCDLPLEQRLKNIGSHRDGAGMCVMSSIEMAARWANLEDYRGLRDWCAREPGGAYPSKVDRQLSAYSTTRRVPLPEYAQLESRGLLDTVRAILRTGRVACVTYSGQDGVRYRGRIAHMVCVVHCDDQQVAILDNNAIGANELLWMSPREFEKRLEGMGEGWVFYWHAPPPPPVPHN